LLQYHREYTVQTYHSEFINESASNPANLDHCLKQQNSDLTDFSIKISEDSMSILNVINMEVNELSNCAENLLSNSEFDCIDKSQNIEPCVLDKFCQWVNKCLINCKEDNCSFHSRTIENFDKHIVYEHSKTFSHYCYNHDIDSSSPWTESILHTCRLCAITLKNNENDIEAHMKESHNTSGLLYYLENIESEPKVHANDDETTSASLCAQLDEALFDMNKNDDAGSDESDLEILVDVWDRKKKCFNVTESESIVMDVKVDL